MIGNSGYANGEGIGCVIDDIQIYESGTYPGTGRTAGGNVGAAVRGYRC